MNLKAKLIIIFSLIIILFTLLYLTKKAINRFTLLRAIEPNRKKVIIGLCYFAYYVLIILAALLLIDVKAKQLVIFASSILAVLGVGFFAQWSMLSNLTASVILFFYHPIRIGRKIKILENEKTITGIITDIKAFYTSLKTDENKIIIIPNSVILYKSIELIDEIDLPNNNEK